MRRHVRSTLVLAIPVIIARSGQLIMQATDTAMTGHYAVRELAYLGLGAVPAVTLMLIGMGSLHGVSILAAQAAGAGETGRCGSIWKVGLVHGLILGTLLMGLCHLAEPFFLAIGQDPELAAGAARVTVAYGWSMPAVMAYSATSYFMEAIGRPLPGMVIMLSANVLNAGLNWLLIYGHGGLPAMGAEGAILGTATTRWCVAVLFIAYVLRMPGRYRYGVTARIREFATLGRKLRRLGYPVGLSHGMEVSAFMTVTLMAGYLGAVPLAGYQVATSLNVLIFMSAVGVAIATSVRVGNCVGAGDRIGRNLAGWTGLILVLALSVLVAVLMLSLPRTLAGIFSDDAAVLAVAGAVISVVGLMFVFNGIEAVMIFALRGSGEVWAPLVMQVGALWLVGLPLAAVLAFELGYGAVGLTIGLYSGLALSAALASARFLVVSRRPTARV